jgi:LysR family transcriptional regulator, benzoate and cis,cis-muconate-responsive activator of ben and cat genes
MELRHLRYFVAAAEELNFSRAAERMRVSQPPLSRQIRNLEEEIGAPLFDRTRPALQLTPAGKAFLDQARQILAQSDRAVRLAKAVSQGKSGQMTVAFLSPVGGFFLPAALRKFQQKFPLVEVTLIEMVPRRQVNALLDGRIDMGIMSREEARLEKDLALEPVTEVEMIAALPPEHALTSLRKVPLQKLAGEPLVFFKRTSAPGLHDWIRDLCRASGFEPDIVRQCDQAQAMLDSVAGGIGIAIVPELFRRYHSEAAFRPLAPHTPKTQLCMVWRRRDHSEALQALRAILLQTFRERSRKQSTTES